MKYWWSIEMRISRQKVHKNDEKLGFSGVSVYY